MKTPESSNLYATQSDSLIYYVPWGVRGFCAVNDVVYVKETKRSGAIAIPSSLGGKPVTSIGDRMFKGCRGLTSVTIGNSVTSIGNWIFSGCSGLTRVKIGSGVTSIGERAFKGCLGLKGFAVSPDNPKYKSAAGLLLSKDGKTLFRVPGGLTDVTIPNSVTSIGDEAFKCCSGLKRVTIPSSVTSIGDEAFDGNVEMIREATADTSEAERSRGESKGIWWEMVVSFLIIGGGVWWAFRRARKAGGA